MTSIEYVGYWFCRIVRQPLFLIIERNQSTVNIPSVHRECSPGVSHTAFLRCGAAVFVHWDITQTEINLQSRQDTWGITLVCTLACHKYHKRRVHLESVIKLRPYGIAYPFDLMCELWPRIVLDQLIGCLVFRFVLIGQGIL